MAGHRESDRARLFSQKMNHCNDYSLAEFLFPIDNSEAPRITQAIADEVRLSNKLKDRVKTVFLHLMRGYGFYRPQVIPSARICLRPKNSKTVNWDAQTWLSHEHPEHSRIRRIILVLRIFDLGDVAKAFFTALTSERITSKVCANSQSQWKAALDQDIPEYLAENSSEKENSDSTESSDLNSLFDESDDNAPGEPLSSEQQKLLERLIKEGTKEFAGRKRSRNEKEDNDNEPPSKRQKIEPVTWDRVREWLESYRNSEPALTWTKELYQRMEAHRKAYNAKPKSERKEFNLPYMSSVVPWAIGSLWAPLRPTRKFGFGESGLFERNVRELINKGVLKSVQACGQRYEQFLMPMFFPSHAQEKDGDKAANVAGHLIFTLAEKTLDNYDDVVIHVCNSLPAWFQGTGKNADEEIEEEAQAILHASNWLARRDDSEELKNRPFNITIKSVTVPIQGTLEHACGPHTILTAWAILLGIPLHEQHHRRGSLPERPFLTLGTEIVNLAIAGCMDSHTIQAFLAVSGMISEQDVNDKSARRGPVNTFLMDDPKLKSAIDDGVLDEVLAATT